MAKRQKMHRKTQAKQRAEKLEKACKEIIEQCLIATEATNKKKEEVARLLDQFISSSD